VSDQMKRAVVIMLKSVDMMHLILWYLMTTSGSYGTTLSSYVKCDHACS